MDRRAPALVLLLAAVGLASAPALAKPPSWDKRIDGKKRFKVLSAFDGEAVLDKETGLVWERAPSPDSTPWDDLFLCENRQVGGRLGWRMPAVHELSSLIDRTQSDPALPEQHPFEGADGEYWSATTARGLDIFSMTVDMGSGVVAGSNKTTITQRTWCVRGPGGEDGGH